MSIKKLEMVFVKTIPLTICLPLLTLFCHNLYFTECALFVSNALLKNLDMVATVPNDKRLIKGKIWVGRDVTIHFVCKISNETFASLITSSE